MNAGISALNADVIHRSDLNSVPRSMSGPDHAAVLTSWKDIARYMGKGVRTVQRWEQDFGLPVRRPHGANKKAILARPRDLDAWVAMRCTSRMQDGKAFAELRPNSAARSRLSPADRCLLHMQIETARRLREDNHALLLEMRTALETLRERLKLMCNDKAA